MNQSHKNPHAGAVQDELPGIVRAVPDEGTWSLDRSIADILDVMREELVMDIVFISRQSGDDLVIRHATVQTGETSLEGMTHPKNQSFCERVLDGRLPAVMPDVQALRPTHDVPVTPLTPGAYMATPVVLQCGTLYGTLCCFNSAVLPDLNERHYQRLQMSARQIARLVDEAGGS